MRATATQLAAFDALDEGHKRTQKQMIVDLFASHDLTLTREEIAERTNMRLSSVCGRTRALLDAGLLIVRGTRKCAATGKYQETIGLPDAVVTAQAAYVRAMSELRAA